MAGTLHLSMNEQEIALNLLKCRVCGLIQDEFPWGEDGKNSSFDICHCCGVEFGYEDATSTAVQRYRANWLAQGGCWKYPTYKPDNWDLQSQLAGIPEL
jgi:hypothetical protein